MSAMAKMGFGVAGVALLTAAAQNLPAFALGTGEVYNFAQVRSHQFVETWSSVRGGAIHVRVHVANQAGGIAGALGGAFTPVVTLSFRDQQGRQIAHYVMHLIAKGKVADSELDIPGGAAAWGATKEIVASAAEDHYSVPPPNTFNFIDTTF